MRRTFTIVAALFVVSGSLFTGCTQAFAPRAQGFEGDMLSQAESAAAAAKDSGVLNESLFKDDQKVISNEDVARILSSKIMLPPHGKLAVVRAGRLPYWFGWSEDFTRLNREIDQQCLDKIKSAPRVRDAVYLPSMAVPRDLTIPHLRQAAARFQADLLLVYRTYSQTYDRQKFFGTDQTRAYATLEAILIDTRTGVVPYSTIVTEDFSAKRERRDVDFSETVAKAEQQAIAKAQLQMAERVVGFCNTLAE
jgi:hypothetical protein